MAPSPGLATGACTSMPQNDDDRQRRLALLAGDVRRLADGTARAIAEAVALNVFSLLSPDVRLALLVAERSLSAWAAMLERQTS